MRRLALASLAAVTGCNWIYGLDATRALDAAPPAEVLPPAPRTKLVWAIATTDGTPAPPMLDPVLVYEPIGSEVLHPALPTVQVGDETGLMDAPYDPADGSFEIPYGLRESPHRILYTLPGESIAHEVQWSVTGATITVPRTTRHDAPAAPGNAGYRITPVGLIGPLISPALFTSGVFTYTNNASEFEQNGSVITYRYAMYAHPLTAPGGAPEKSQGDWVLLGEFGSRGDGQSSLVGYALTQIELAGNTMGQPDSEPMWISGLASERTISTGACPGVNCLPQPNKGQVNGRLDAALGSLGGTASEELAYGVSPSTELPGFLPGVAPGYLPRPLMLPFLVTDGLDATLKLTDPSDLLGLERVVYASARRSRMIDNVTLTSAIQAVTNKFSGSIEYLAPLVISMKLGATSLSVADTDGAPIPGSSSLQKLTFQTEAGYTADDFVVTLYELAGVAPSRTLVPVRIYHVLGPEVKIDGTLLVAGHEYVFGITARSGYGAADRGDYTKAQYPFGVSTTFGRTFVIQ